MDLKAIINTEPDQESQNNRASSHLPPTPTAQYRRSTNGLYEGNISPSFSSNTSISPGTETHDGKRKRSADSEHESAPPAKAPRPLSQPSRKRFKPLPIWATPARGLPLLKKYRKVPSRVATTNGSSQNDAPRGAMDPQAGREPPMTELSPYEETFDNACPSDEVVRYVCDFLFRCVIANEALETSQNGSIPSPHGQLEIEAKIGTLVARNSDVRMTLPVRSEAIINEGLDVAFVSNMTSDQHRKTNNYLNEQVKASQLAQMPGMVKTRSPLHYKRLREVDTFYDLPAGELQVLPPAVKSRLEANAHRFKPRLRVTRDLQSGQVLAKIIKTRVQDLHVYNANPCFPFDWRISVNVEMNWEGNLEALLASGGSDGRQEALHEREKNRLSYSHQFCQIDLTQVTPTAEAEGRGERATHELEVELDSAEVKQQCRLLRQGQPNHYESLVRGFVNNVRILSGKGGFLS